MVLSLHLAFLLAALPGAGPLAAQEAGYLGSQSCADCHPAESEAWSNSHHALAWTSATPEHIRADFNGTEFALGDMTVKFGINDAGSPHAAVTELDGRTTDYPVHSVVGIEPLQQYLFETAPGRLQSFDVVWDTVKGGWFHLYPDQNVPPSDGMHWTGPYKTWNSRCATCHATDYKANYDPATRSYASTQAEIGVGCEACHGPGADHVAWARKWETTREAPPPHHGFRRDLSDPAAFLDTCGGCHSRREGYFDGTPPYGTAYHDAYNLAQLRPGLYWPDGQIRDEVYVTGSFLQSKMYARGVGCINCHEPHSARTKAAGNAVCTACHSPAGNTEFPTLPLGEYDSEAHHHHAPETPGAECKNCHMVEQVYMGNDWRADHSFRIPRPDLNAATGAPDACTTCHTDRTADWAAETLRGWFPESTHRGPHYGEVLARGIADPAAAWPDLAGLAQDGGQPGIVRATALWLMGQEGRALDDAAIEALFADPDPMVRAAAVDAQQAAYDPARVMQVAGMLDDPSRSVRIAAAKAMLGAPIAYLPRAIASKLERAQRDWQAAMLARLDFPETHLQLGGMALSTRRFPAAAQAFAEATRLDPQQVDAWVMRVRLAAELEGPDAAQKLLDEALTANPDAAVLKDLIAPANERKN